MPESHQSAAADRRPGEHSHCRSSSWRSLTKISSESVLSVLRTVAYFGCVLGGQSGAVSKRVKSRHISAVGEACRVV